MLKKIFLTTVLFLSCVYFAACTDAEGFKKNVEDFVSENVQAIETLPSIGNNTVTSFERVKVDSAVALQNQGYYYSCLNSEEKAVYDELYIIFSERKDDLSVSTTDEMILSNAAEAVLLDHPEMFYLDRYGYTTHMLNGEIISIVPKGIYICSQDELIALQAQVDEYVEKIAEGIPADADDYSKIKAVYEYIIRNTDYVVDSPNNQNILSVMLNGESVCSGYARSFMYILEKLGVECIYVTGTGKSGEAHAWNIVRADGDYYHVDVTWGDSSFTNELGEEMQKLVEIDYDYLFVSDEWILKNHTISQDYALPKCSSLELNYYIREGLYFESLDKNRMSELFKQAYKDSRDYMFFKCSDERVFLMWENYLFDEKHIWDYLKNKKRVSYYTSPDAYSFIVLLK